MFNNLPNLLTWLRILVIPLMVGLYSLPWDGWALQSRNEWATALFVVAAITDWVDGWLARRLGQQTAFGAFLDPVADKLLVCVALVMLLELGRVSAWVAAIFIGREITISALREWMATLGARKSVAVHSLGKFKTAAQMVALPLLLFSERLPGMPMAAPDWLRTGQGLGTCLVWVAAVLTLWSMFYYLKQAWPLLKGHAS